VLAQREFVFLFFIGREPATELALLVRFAWLYDGRIDINVKRMKQVGIANVNLSNIKTGKISAIRFSTLNAICDVLDCQPGDILEFNRDDV
jgi:Predicted transcriptional regulator